MLTSSSTCSNLHQLAKTWQEAFEDSHAALQRFQATFSPDDRSVLTQALETTRIAQMAYEQASNVLTNHEGKQVIAREAVLLEWMNGLVGEVEIEVSETGNVTIMRVTNNRSAESSINNALKFLKVFKGLTELHCSNNPNLSSLPDLPRGLTWLDCYNNPNLSSLPDLPRGLTWLDCSNNPKLSSLPDLPQGLTLFYCHNNPNLSSLPELPRGLTKLVCSNTNLSSLPELPPGLTRLNCSNNHNLSSLPDPLPDTLAYINIRITPAAQNQQVIDRLKQFEKSHPHAEVKY